jgi:hypothetical protein
MNVCEVRQLVREWINAYGSQDPTFRGAHLMGSINTIPEDAPFPGYRDVDFALVLDIDKDRPNQEVSYKGLILECASASISKYRPLQSVLSNPGLAPNLALDSILSDPTGVLHELHQAVKKEFARREWVVARCEWEKVQVLRHLDALGKARSPGEVSYLLAMVLNFLSGLMAVAYLQMPTHRRCLVLMKELLERAGRAKVYKDVLRTFGSVHMTRSRIESYLKAGLSAFDRAVEVHRTDSPYGFKLHPHVRPYFADATKEMIGEGYHREAVAWIWTLHYLSNAAIQNDAPEEDKHKFQAGFDDLLRGLGLLAPEGWPSRRQAARELADEVFAIADRVVESHPDIVD